MRAFVPPTGLCRTYASPKVFKVSWMRFLYCHAFGLSSSSFRFVCLFPLVFNLKLCLARFVQSPKRAC